MFLLLPSSAVASSIIQCDGAAGSPVRVILNATSRFGTAVNCIEGDFPTEGEACAPDGGFGLAAPTGSGSLVRIAQRWQDYIGHIGPIYGVNISDTLIAFTGGYQGVSKWSDQWLFNVDRTTGAGAFSIIDPHTQRYKLRARFTCRAVTQKF